MIAVFRNIDPVLTRAMAHSVRVGVRAMNNTRKSVHRRPSYSIEYGKLVTGYGRGKAQQQK
jgi:hypothetical protein